MTSRRRRSALVGAVGAGLLALSACAAGGWGVGGSTGSKVHLTYALWDAHQQVGYQKSIDLFEKQHPDIKVTIEQVPYSSYKAKITAQYISGDAPDVFWVNTPWIADWVTGGVLTDITERVRAAHVDLSQYYPALVRLHEYNGHLYGLPKDWDTIAFYYNKNYFKKVGVTPSSRLTWSPDGGGSFVPFLERLTTDKAGHNATEPAFDPHSVQTYATASTNDLQGSYGNYLAMNGGSVLPRQYATRSTLDSPQNLETFTWLTRTLPSRHVVVPASLTGSNGASDNLQTLFSQGRMAMYQTGDWLTSSIAALSSSAFKVGVMPLPSGPRGRISVFNGLTDGIASNTRYPDQAWELVRWLASPRSQRILGAGGYVWPAIQRLDPLFRDYWRKHGIDVGPFLAEARGKTVTFPVATGFGEAQDNMTTALGPTYLGTSSVRAGLQSAARILDYRISFETR